MTSTLEEELLLREKERQAALVSDDMAAFAALMCDDIVHVHATGNVHGKSEVLGHAGGFIRFHAIERGDLLIRPIGDDAAIMTGPMTNTVGRRESDERVTVEAYVTQVWVRESSDWKMKSFHAVRLPVDAPTQATGAKGKDSD
ncbi:nuclear transport factor 2 family protein [Alteraurantiacibacter buctensis]|uniref:DUF4440 domain-containing protein n=1 Tax=Alteraurantiacibacter buctensis TaxID=1503981 RepID=A0A844YXV0_9SPHN|nr:nuclear transport factor 2 family protein [Alteraurantiacibacter buctensis]MXO71790.1 DUF4440 domain-containing protein [Alteraurantiacibacter buctensis]